jgi:hypothetical protein
MADEELRLIDLVVIQPRKVTGKGKSKKPSSYMLTIPRDCWGSLGVRERKRKEKVKVFVDEKKKQLVYQF